MGVQTVLAVFFLQQLLTAFGYPSGAPDCSLFHPQGQHSSNSATEPGSLTFADPTTSEQYDVINQGYIPGKTYKSKCPSLSAAGPFANNSDDSYHHKASSHEGDSVSFLGWESFHTKCQHSWSPKILRLRRFHTHQAPELASVLRAAVDSATS